ncbi:hypothetical protein C4K00_2707 [Pseudomonas synxantha]|nr:hypothetical protein C4K00_2707 [Pseudomonas synxantha]
MKCLGGIYRRAVGPQATPDSTGAPHTGLAKPVSQVEGFDHCRCNALERLFQLIYRVKKS